MSWKDFDSTCNRLIVDVGAGNFEAEQFQVYGKMDVSVGVGNVEITDGVVYGDVALDCGVGNFSMEGSVEGNLKADCGMGSMTLDLNGEEKSITTSFPADLVRLMWMVKLTQTSAEIKKSKMKGQRKYGT